MLYERLGRFSLLSRRPSALSGAERERAARFSPQALLFPLWKWRYSGWPYLAIMAVDLSYGASSTCKKELNGLSNVHVAARVASGARFPPFGAFKNRIYVAYQRWYLGSLPRFDTYVIT